MKVDKGEMRTGDWGLGAGDWGLVYQHVQDFIQGN